MHEGERGRCGGRGEEGRKLIKQGTRWGRLQGEEACLPAYVVVHLFGTRCDDYGVCDSFCANVLNISLIFSWQFF